MEKPSTCLKENTASLRSDAHTVGKTLAVARAHQPHIVLLDIAMPGIDGFEVCHRLRLHDDIAIIVLTARDEVTDKVSALNLGALGGLAELEEQDGTYIIRGYSCPLAMVVPGHPEICRLVESLLTELVGTKVEEQCDRSEKVSCRFVVPAS